MGKIDIVTRQYLAKPERFAQICNHALFGGKKLIRPELLHDLNATEHQWIKHLSKPEERQRDLIKQYDGRELILIIGLESQNAIHYAMPLRHMLYDALRYNSQYEHLTQKHQKEKDLHSSEEFLTGISKSEHLYPIITLCIYWGAKPWDAPKNLHEMLDISPDIAQYKDRIGNYPLNLLEIRKIEDLEHYQGELKALLGFVKYQSDKEALGHFVQENIDMFRNMSAETLYAMSVLGNSRELQERITQIKEQSKNLEEVHIDMCQAIREMIEEGRAEGRLEGRLESENLLNRLYLQLLDEGRLEDLRRSMTDRDYQKALYTEYGLSSGSL